MNFRFLPLGEHFNSWLDADFGSAVGWVVQHPNRRSTSRSKSWRSNASNWQSLLCIPDRLAVRPADGACAMLSPAHIHKRYGIAWLRSTLAP